MMCGPMPFCNVPSSAMVMGTVAAVECVGCVPSLWGGGCALHHSWGLCFCHVSGPVVRGSGGSSDPLQMPVYPAAGRSAGGCAWQTCLCTPSRHAFESMLSNGRRAAAVAKCMPGLWESSAAVCTGMHSCTMLHPCCLWPLVLLPRRATWADPPLPSCFVLCLWALVHVHNTPLALRCTATVVYTCLVLLYHWS